MSRRDEKGRLLPGSATGWGMSWWLVDQAHVSPAQFGALTPGERLALIQRFWRAVADGWRPDVSPEEWVGPHDPFSSLATGDQDPDDAERVAAALDAIPDALARTRAGTEQAAHGEGVPLERLADPDAPKPTRDRLAAVAPDPWLARIRHAVAHGPADPERPDREIREVLALTLTAAGAERWFGLPNYLLGGRRPADALADDPRAVLRAACELAFGAG